MISTITVVTCWLLLVIYILGVTEKRNLFQSITDAIDITLAEDPTSSEYIS